MHSDPSKTDCLLCGATPLAPVAAEVRLGCVSSDGFPVEGAAAFAVCPACGLIQKVRDEDWNRIVSSIYANYKVYPLETIQTHLTFSEAGVAESRSLILARRLAEAAQLPPQGRLLDVGCGNGDFLRSFRHVRPQWDLCGYEPSEVKRATLEEHLPGITFYSGSMDTIADRFDCVTLNYVIEHLVQPSAVLRQIKSVLRPGGGVFAQTTSFQRNPFDLIIMDHCAHFTPETLALTAALAELRIAVSSNDWLEKEIGWYARPDAAPVLDAAGTMDRPAVRDCEKMVRWLRQFPNTVRQAAQGRPLGIFGTAIAGSWLAGIMPGEVDFFVDEDPQRQGQRHLGLPILAPENAPAAAAVVLAFPAAIALGIAKRHEENGIHFAWILPPAFEDDGLCDDRCCSTASCRSQ